MADVEVVTDSPGVSAFINERDSMNGPYWTSPLVGYIVQSDNNSDTEVWKTDDGGASWVEQDTANNPDSVNNRSMAVWFDPETPGSTGTLIHIAVVRTNDNQVDYISFDTSDDTFGTLRVVDLLTILAGSNVSEVGITVSKSGRVYVTARGNAAGDIEDTDHSMRSSSDNFASNNESEASPFTSDEEIIKLYPGADADEDDICAVVYDRGNSDLEFWKFDASANSWSKTAIDNTVSINLVEAALYKGGFDAAIRHSDEHILVVYWTDVDDPNGDFKCADITQATPTITGKTNLDTDTDDSFLAAIQINQQNGDIRVAYVGSDDGLEVWNDTVRVYFKLSTDDMDSWGSEQSYSVQNDDLRAISAGHSVGNDGGRWMPVWFNDDDVALWVNDGNDVEILELSLLTIPIFSPGPVIA